MQAVGPSPAWNYPGIMGTGLVQEADAEAGERVSTEHGLCGAEPGLSGRQSRPQVHWPVLRGHGQTASPSALCPGPHPLRSPPTPNHRHGLPGSQAPHPGRCDVTLLA